ncbi:MerC domain-containing protein [Sphingobium algorifonticola]|uniref:MerC domain-containing protein n=2 Tax=Sphingobium algorifonticola TaxID=2008318 RepID=A0A437J864_9SPHN|nr:MerC domain-containing protein [Sphingobium algorifonticola]
MMLGGVCLVHCLALPLLFALLPGIGGLLPGHHFVHILLLAIAMPISGLALYNGWRRRGDRLAPVMGGIGLMVLSAALIVGEAGETPITMTGSLLLVAAHIRNWRALAR